MLIQIRMNHVAQVTLTEEGAETLRHAAKIWDGYEKYEHIEEGTTLTLTVGMIMEMFGREMDEGGTNNFFVNDTILVGSETLV